MGFEIENGVLEKYIDEGETKIVIPDEVTSIGDYAFEGCTGLTSVTIPSSVISIGNHAFDECTGLTSVTIPDSIITIGAFAFDHCANLKYISIPESVSSIGYKAFRNCDGLTQITVDEKNTSYKSEDGVLFDYDKTKLIKYPVGNERTSYTIPHGINRICENAFENCVNLTSVTISEGVTEIDYYAFENCDSLTSIKLSSSITNIDSDAFAYCNNLTSIDIPSNNQYYSSLDGVLFDYYKTKLIQYPIGNARTSYIMPNSVICINECAFADCSNLVSVTLSDNVGVDLNLGTFSSFYFHHLDNLAEITISEKSEYYFSEDGVLFNKNKSELILYPKNKPEASYNIPDSVTSISNYAFAECTNLTSITIPDSVTSIGSLAFCCPNIKTVTIPKSVTNIESNSFGYYITDYRTGPESGWGLTYSYLTDFQIFCYKDTAGEQYAKNTPFDYEIITSDTHIHSYTGKITKKPTCTADGIKTYTCSCGDTYTETIKSTGHTYSTSWTIDKAATCTAAGSKSHHCTVCGAKTDVTAIPKKSHTYKTTVVAPTYAAQGYTLHKCSSCGTSYKDKYTAKKTVPTVTAKSTYTYTTNAVRINWNKVSGATGYKIYRYNPTTKQWTALKAIYDANTLTYKDSSLKSGTVYKYKVKAFVKSGVKFYFGSSCSTITTATKPATATITKTAKSSTAIRLYWKKATCTGYKIQRYNSTTKKWVDVKTVSSATTGYRIASLKKNTSYKFRVCAYKNDGKKNLYGAWSYITVKTTK